MQPDSSAISQYLSWIYPNETTLINIFYRLDDGTTVGKTFATRQEAIERATNAATAIDVAAVWTSVHQPKQTAWGNKWNEADHIAAYQFLAIDVDAIRADGFGKYCSTDAEHEATLLVARSIMTTFADDLPQPLLVDSGNGTLLLYPIHLPFNKESKSLMVRLAKALATAFTTEQADIDTLVVRNAAGILGVVGTMNRNKLSATDRPQRIRKVIGEYPSREPMEAEAFVAWAKGYIGEHEALSFDDDSAGALSPTIPTTTTTPSVTAATTEATKVERLQAASAYLAKCDPAIEGRKGEPRTFNIAGHLLSFGLTVAEVHNLMLTSDWNKSCQPPWESAELLEKVVGASKYGKAKAPKEVGIETWTSSLPSTETSPATTTHEGEPQCADLFNAEKFVAKYGQNLRYVHEWKKWIAWNGNHWEITETEQIRATYVHAFVRNDLPSIRFSNMDQQKRWFAWCSQSCNAYHVNSIAQMAADKLMIKVEQLDANPMLFACRNAVIDLATCQPIEPRREQWITAVSNVDYDASAKAPLFEKFLSEILVDNEGRRSPELVEYVQRILGYCLTASVEEQIFFICHGSGANGKSTLWDTLQAILGQYAIVGSTDLYFAKERGGSHSEDVASLWSKRLCVTSETSEGRRLSDAKIKNLTGGDKLTAMRKYEHPFAFDPTHKLVLLCNHLPKISVDDPAMLRRIKLIPFNHVVPDAKKDIQLKAKLIAEAPGILNFMLEGLKAWRNGKTLQPQANTPEICRAATQGYFKDNDTLQEFIDERLEKVEGQKVERKAVYAVYRAWAEQNG